MNKLVVGQEVSIQMDDGYYIDRCVVEGVGPNIGMVSHHNEKEGVILNEIAQVTKLKPSAVSKGKSKKEVAIELHKKYPQESRKRVIEMLVEDAGMSKAGAATYYQNIWRAKC